MNANTPFVEYLVAEGLLPKDDLFLVDVGASGGIDHAWQVLGPHLRAVGFDPLVNEVQRLNRENTAANVCYVDGFVGAQDYDALFPPELASDLVRGRSNHSHQRSSSLRAANLGEMNYEKEVFNRGQEMILSSRHLALDDYFPPEQRGAIDFIKIDTDGSDYQVLVGAKGLLESGGVLGVTIECQFHGAVHDHANLFCNIDRCLRGCGFSLYDLEVHRYSRAELPQPFVYDIPAQTLRGQVQWGEALYFRDLTDPDYGSKWGHGYGLAKQIKLACLFELFHLQDCAVELLLRHRAAFESVLPVDRCLDLLTPARNGRTISYQEHEREFIHWASRRQWLQFGRNAPSAEPAVTSPQAAYELCARLGRFLGRALPVPPREVQSTETALLAIMQANDGHQAAQQLLAQGPLSPILQPLLLNHIGVAWKTQNAALAEKLELIYGWLISAPSIFPTAGSFAP